MKVVPLGEHIVVKRMDAEETSPGGVYLPEALRQDLHQGRVLSVGDGRLLSTGERAGHQVSEGDRIVFRNYAGTEVVLDGEEYLIMNEDDILAVVSA